jgi:hypothetical protein
MAWAEIRQTRRHIHHDLRDIGLLELIRQMSAHPKFMLGLG